LQRVAYLNAGTCGPLPAAALTAVTEALQTATVEGRGAAYHGALRASRPRLRECYASLLGADPADVALTTGTSDGIVRVLTGLDLRPGDEVVTSDDEHPGIAGPLGAARAQRGIAVRAVPFEQLASAVTPATKLVACSHVSWVSGAVVPDMSRLDRDVPVLLDGAQSVGAVPIDLAALRCAFYAGSGQKWLCGPVGTGMLWVSPAWRERLAARGPTNVNLADPDAGLDAVPLPSAARHDAPSHSLESIAAAAAACAVLAAAGWDAVHERAAALAQSLADALEQRGHRVVPRGATTLVAWRDDDALATRDRLLDAGVVVRNLAGRSLLRASVGAWNDASDLERLLSALD
jgi:L-cysteine/cystine lyase